MKSTTMRAAVSLVAVLAACLLLCEVVNAQTKIKGPISSRNGDSMVVKGKAEM